MNNEHSDDTMNVNSELSKFDLNDLDDPPPTIHFKGKRFVFTGRLLYGSHDQCAQRTRELGGLVDETVTLETDYVVVGTQAGEHWKQTLYLATEYRERPDCNLKIVSGIAWATWLKAHRLGHVN